MTMGTSDAATDVPGGDQVTDEPTIDVCVSHLRMPEDEAPQSMKMHVCLLLANVANHNEPLARRVVGCNALPAVASILQARTTESPLRAAGLRVGPLEPINLREIPSFLLTAWYRHWLKLYEMCGLALGGPANFLSANLLKNRLLAGADVQPGRQALHRARRNGRTAECHATDSSITG